jgi:NADH:ubiquinone oxidoreductase subunit E
MLTVELCMGTACHLMGAQELMDAVDSLPVEMRLQIEVKGITCHKKCGKGPNVKINGELLNNATPEKLKEVLQNKLQ